MPVPVAQSGKCWTPYGGSTRHIYRLQKSVVRLRDVRLMFVSLLAGMVAVDGEPQLGEGGEGTGRARLCA